MRKAVLSLHQSKYSISYLLEAAAVLNFIIAGNLFRSTKFLTISSKNRHGMDIRYRERNKIYTCLIGIG